jgi:serine/threonine protein kinase
MTTDRATRLNEIGAVLAERMPVVLDAAITLLESVAPAPDAAHPERYQIERKIGDGGQAEVLLGTVRGAEGFHRLVAIKRVRADRADEAKSASTLIEEAHLASQFSHPNVVSVLDLDRDQLGRFFLVMEHVAGIDLAKLFELGPVPYAVAIFIVRELLSGLEYIHELRGPGGVRGLVHRDVSPQNVLLSWQGEVKLADFGVAQGMEGTTTAGAMLPVGKAGYMSPEQVNCQPLDARSDLYAVGIVLWELLALQHLQVGPVGGLKTRAIFQDVPRPSEYRPNIPADLEAVAMRLLAFDREDRYRTAELAARDLMRCQDAPRDGRGDLTRLLDERYPRSRRQSPRLSSPSALGTPSEGPVTMTASPAPPEAPPAPWLMEQWEGQIYGSTWDRVQLWWQMLACGLLFASALAAAIAFVVMK